LIGEKLFSSLLCFLRQAAFFGPTVANGALRTWLDLQLAPPVAIDTRQPQDGTLKKGLHRPRLNAIIPILTAAGSHPDCRAVLIQIVALYHGIDDPTRRLRRALL